jgi:hypothetical protein
MASFYIRTNNSQATDVLIGDMGIIIPNSGQLSDEFTETREIQIAQESVYLKAFLTDDAYGVNSSTLILVRDDGITDIPQSEVLIYLARINSTVQNWFGGWA